MVLAEENRSSWRKTVPSASLFGRNPTSTGILLTWKEENIMLCKKIRLP
jgi:hypothetical protein